MKTDIKNAIDLLKKGELVAFPTETVYGLGGDANNPNAVEKIFQLKQRPVNHPLIIHVAKIEHAMQYAHFSQAALEIAEQFWPGPLTLILEKTAATHPIVTGNRSTVGIRIPSHPTALELLEAVNRPIAAPSANPFGTISPTKAEHVNRYFGDALCVLDGGPCTIGLESTILDLIETPAILRPGSIDEHSITTIVGPLGHSQTAAPGRMKAHYAPKTRLILSDTPEKTANSYRKQGLRVACIEPQEPKAYAQKLYAELHRLDQLDFEILVAPKAPEYGIGIAINDRLKKAAAGSQSN